MSKRSFAAGAEIVEQVRINVLPSRAGINGEISQIRRDTARFVPELSKLMPLGWATFWAGFVWSLVSRWNKPGLKFELPDLEETAKPVRLQILFMIG